MLEDVYVGVLVLELLVGAFWIGVGGVCLGGHVVAVDDVDVDVECVGIRIWSDRFCVCVDVEFLAGSGGVVP